VLVVSEELFVRRASGLVRELEWYDVMLWALAAPAASGMTYYAAKMLGDPTAYGGDPVMAFFIAGLLFLPPMLAFMVIATSFPRSSSLYVFVSRTLHPALGYMSFWYFIIGGGCALASGFLAYIGIKALAGPLAVAGVLTGNPTLLSLSYVVTDPVNQLVIALVVIVIVWLLNIFGARVLKWTMRVLVTIPLIITIIALGALALAGPNAFYNNWDKVFGPGTTEAITKLAYTGSYGDVKIDQPLTKVAYWDGTMSMLLWTIWAWTGLEVVTFIGSEVKHPTKSYVKGYIGGFLGVMILYLVNAFLIPFSGNYDFLAAYSYLKMDYPDQLSAILKGLPTPDPSVPFVVSVVLMNPAIAIIVGVAYFLWYLNTIIPIWVAGVRGFFSMAFDRMLPEKLAEVSPKWASPTWANHVMAIVALFGVLFTYLDALGSTLAAAVVSFMDFSCLFFVWPVGLALMLAPWWRPDLHKQMTWQSKALLFTIGALTFAIGWYFMVFTAYKELLVMLVNIIVGLLGVTIFAAMSARNRDRGIEVEKIYYTIPPA
jgi:amino acid transporter